MHKIDKKVSFLNRFKSITVKKIIIRKKFDRLQNISKIEEKLSDLLDIKEGTVFCVEHETTYTPRIYLEKLIKMGLVERYGEGPIFADYPKIHHASISHYVDESTAEIDDIDDGNGKKQMAWGFTFKEERSEMALLKALFESVERQSMYYTSSSKTVFYPKMYKGDASFLYPSIPHFRKVQTNAFPILVKSEEDLKNILGFKAESLLTGKKRFLPLSCFYFGMDLLKERMPIMFDPTSSGGGAGLTQENAKLSALYELIERDHFLLYWLSGVTPSLISLEHEDSFVSRYVQHMKERYNLEVYIFDMRYDFTLKACYVVIIDPVLNIITCGAKVGHDGEKAVEGAILEALAVLNSVRSFGMMKSEEELREILKTNTLINNDISKSGRVNMYCSAFGVSLIRTRILQNNTVISFKEFNAGMKLFSSKKQELAFILDEFKQVKKEKGEGYDVFFHEHASVYTKEIGCFVAHVFVPEFIKLYLFEPCATPLSSRLFEFAKVKGLNNFSENDIVTLPHFFP